MPITDLATNVILDNVGKVYFLKTGVYRDQVGLDNNHPLSSVSALLIHIEDGVPQNVMVANYAPSKMASWASHDFPLWYRGQVEYTITGESSPRTFAQYFTYVPSILVAMNKNGTSIMDVNVTITQSTGANLLGGFADLTALNSEFSLADPVVAEGLADDLATAYVYDSGTKGFYRVAWNSVASAWVWQLVDQALVTYGVQTKQYNVLPIKVQRGFAPNQTPLTVSDEVIRLIYQEIAYVNAVIANHTELIGDLDDELVAHMADLDNPHEVTALQTAYSNIVSLLTATTVQGAIDEIVARVDTAEEDIVALEGRMDTAEEDIDDLETFRDTTVPATYETLTSAATHKGRTTALENANMVKSIAVVGTNLFTITFYDNTTSNILTLAQLKTFIGEATNALSGLMTAQHVTDLEMLMALFDGDGDSVVNTIAEVLAIFESYPEGVDLVTALAGKVDKTTKIAGVDLQNDITKDEMKVALDIDDLESTKVDKTTTIAGVDMQNNITKEELQVALDVDDKVDKVTGKSLVEDTEIAKLEDLETQAQTDAKFNLKLDKDISTLELYNIVDTDLFFKRSASGVLQRVTAQQAKDYFVSAGLTFDATVNYMTNGLGAFKSAVTMIHPVTLQTNGDFRCSIRAIETNTFIYVLFPTITATNTLRVSTDNGTTYYNVLKNGSTMRASIVSGQLVRLQFDGTNFIADIQSDVEVSETYTTKLNSTFGKFAPLDRGVPIVKEIQGRTIPALENLVTNGDFSNGTTGWVDENTNTTISSGVAVTLATVQFSRLYQEFSTTINHVYLIRAFVKSTSVLAYLSIDGAYTTHSGSGVFETLSISFIETASKTNYVAIRDYRASGWDNIYVDNVMIYDLTALYGVTTTSGTAYDNAVADIEAMLALNGGYISTTPTTHVEDSEFKSVGKNLFDKNDLEVGSINNTTGANVINSLRQRTASYIKVINTTYTFSNNVSDIYVYEYDTYYNFIGLYTAILSSTSSASYAIRNSNTSYIRLRNNDNQDMSDLQLEQGTVATPYAPYNSETQKFNHGALRSTIDKSVRDKIRYLNGAYVKDIYINSADNTALATPLLATEVIDVDGTLIQESTTTVEQLQNIPTSVTIEYSMDVEQTTKTLVERDKLQQLEIDSLEVDVATRLLRLGGITASRPATPSLYQMYFDTTLNVPIWWNGTNWVNHAGTTV